MTPQQPLYTTSMLDQLRRAEVRAPLLFRSQASAGDGSSYSERLQEEVRRQLDVYLRGQQTEVTALRRKVEELTQERNRLQNQQLPEWWTIWSAAQCQGGGLSGGAAQLPGGGLCGGAEQLRWFSIWRRSCGAASRWWIIWGHSFRVADYLDLEVQHSFPGGVYMEVLHGGRSGRCSTASWWTIVVDIVRCSTASWRITGGASQYPAGQQSSQAPFHIMQAHHAIKGRQVRMPKPKKIRLLLSGWGCLPQG